MKFTFDWLRDHLRTNLSYLEISEKLTDLGLEVEQIINQSEQLDNIFVGYIKSANKHPDADKLKVCEVDIGDETLQIVCGASNAREGILVAVAKIGAYIPAFKQKIKKGKIRGIESFGMMCSSEELELDMPYNGGIIELPTNLIIGQKLSSALGLDEIIFDVSITPNRADCFSVRGIARDLAAGDAGELLDLPDFKINENIENPVDLDLQTDNCKLYTTLAIKGISGKTPSYIAKRLKAVGQNLINMPVDIANYVCLDIGQPTHVFDSNKVSKTLTIRDSIQNERIKTLDGVDRIIPSDSIVVSSGNEALSIAGIIGGDNSSVQEITSDIIIESAYFNNVSIAKTGQRLKINTEARTRFERGTDPNNVIIALKYIAHLISTVCDCSISGIKQIGKHIDNQNNIKLTYDDFYNITRLSKKEFQIGKNILEKLGCDIVESDENSITVLTPSWRHDLIIPNDLVEEIIRIIGFDSIEEQELSYMSPKLNISISDVITDMLEYNGFNEVKTFSFIDRKTAEIFANTEQLIELEDASKEFSILRPTIACSHLKAIKNNQNKSQYNSRLFEIGKKFYKENDSLVEDENIIITLTEQTNDRHWRDKSIPVSFYDIKNIVDKIMNTFNINTSIIQNAPSYYHPGRSCTYLSANKHNIAYIGEIHPHIIQQIDVKGPIIIAEINVENLKSVQRDRSKTELLLSQYQPVTRDISVIVDKVITSDQIIKSIAKLKITELIKVSVFDVYESESIGYDKKAIAISFVLQSQKENLTDEKIQQITNSLIESRKQNCGGRLRE